MKLTQAKHEVAALMLIHFKAYGFRCNGGCPVFGHAPMVKASAYTAGVNTCMALINYVATDGKRYHANFDDWPVDQILEAVSKIAAHCPHLENFRNTNK